MSAKSGTKVPFSQKLSDGRPTCAECCVNLASSCFPRLFTTFRDPQKAMRLGLSQKPAKSFKKLLVVMMVGIVLFLASGYLLSDGYFFRKIIQSNQIKTPEQAFEYVVSNTQPASMSMGLTLLTTPRNMLT